MASIYQLKSRFQGILRPLVKRLAAAGVTANQVTMAAAVLSIAAGAGIAIFPTANLPYLLLPLVLFVRMALNAIDGMLAREHAMASRLGAILNELGDVVSDTALYLPFMLAPAIEPWGIVLFCLLAVMAEMMGVVAIQIGASRRYDGPLGKSDRAFAFGLLGFLIGMGFAGGWMNWVIILLCLLAVITIVNRAAKALKEGVGA